MNILKEINFIIHGNYSKKHRKALLYKKYDMEMEHFIKVTYDRFI